MDNNIGFGNNNGNLFDNQINQSDNVSGSDYVCYCCNNCGTKFVLIENTLNCPFCGSNNVIQSNDDIINFDSIIPFNKSLSEAVKAYKKKIINPLVPFAFKKKSVINSIKGVYIPGMLYKSNIHGDSIFLGGNKTSKGQKLSTIQKFELPYTSNFDYNDVYINTCSKIDDKFLYGMSDYNFNSMVEFNKDNISSNIIMPDILEDVTTEKLNKRLMNHALTIIRDNIPYGLKKLDKNEMVLTTSDAKKILVPVYLLNVKYKNKDYLYIMNGYSGKYNLNLTIGVIETVVFSVILFGLIFLLLFLFNYFF